ncbi:MAG: Rrf2 family transcriptional regulator [Deltaproteobacteria bacterium]|nr:Rrf2 family transcriptional regulator [Deltaproteobacteria bacterium]
MRLINRDTDYAAKALIFIAGNNGRVATVSGMAKELNIPNPFLRKILQILNRNGLLKSFKGKGGGFTLAKPPEDIFLIDLIRIFHGDVSLNDCVFNRDICPDIKTCVLKKKIAGIERHVINELKGISIASLAGDAGK